MIIKLDQLYINLFSDIDGVQEEWMNIFALHPVLSNEEARSIDIELTCLRLSDAQIRRWADLGLEGAARPAGELSLTHFSPIHFLLHLPSGVIIEVETKADRLQIYIPLSLSSEIVLGMLEDITTISLAPSLRRRGYLLLHGFGVGLRGTGVILCGPSGSGKTTTGLALLAEGASLYANDNLLLRREGAEFVLIPSFGTVNISRQTAELIGNGPFEIDLENEKRHPVDNKIHLPAIHFNRPILSAVPIRKILFVDYRSDHSSLSKTELSKGEQMARLLSEGVDHWDRDLLGAQAALIGQLVNQVDGYFLHIPSYNSEWKWGEIAKEVMR